jgi:hypothetical protein
MPNWCLNNLTIEHEDIEKVNEFVAAYKRGETCEHYLPTPRDKKGELIDDPKSPNGWWEYRVSNWGTKWDFGGEDQFIEQRGNSVICSYDTAWSPPIGLYERLLVLGFDVHATYFEPGIGFCGVWDNGEDNHYDGGIEDFPRRLVKEYNMVEWYEDDDEDDAPFKLVGVPNHPEA